MPTKRKIMREADEAARVLEDMTELEHLESDVLFHMFCYGIMSGYAYAAVGGCVDQAAVSISYGMALSRETERVIARSLREGASDGA